MADSRKYLTFANLQMAAEAFLQDAVQNPVDLRAALIEGNGRTNKFPDAVADQFVSDFEVIAHRTNSTTGFSGTLFRAKVTDFERGLVAGQLTLSFRSTEFVDDAVRDSKATNELEIKRLGWAIGQIADMEQWYAELKAASAIDPNTGIPAGAQFNVTGYSLGGHLATAFNLLRKEEATASGGTNPIVHTYTFNGAGVGDLAAGVRLTDVVNNFVQWRSDPNSIPWASFPPTFPVGVREEVELQAAARVAEITAEMQRLPGLGIPSLTQVATAQIAQDDFNYQVALLAATRGRTLLVSNAPFAFEGVNPVPTSPVFAAERIANMTEIVGSDGGNLGPSFVANSGIHHGLNRVPVFIEDQPFLRGGWELTQAIQGQLLQAGYPSRDFADTHNLVLLVDSLALMDTFARIDANVSQAQTEQIFKSASNARISGLFFAGQGSAEGDTLESVLDALRRLFVSPDASNTLSEAQHKLALTGGTWADVLNLRNPFHENLKTLNTTIALLKAANPGTHYTIQSLTGFSPTYVESTAKVNDDLGKAYRYALKNLNPFAVVVSGTQPTVYNEQIYAKYERDATPAGLTDQYLEDRATMLGWLNYRNARNDDQVSPSSEVSVPARYTDLATRADGKPTNFWIVAPGGGTGSDISPLNPTLKVFAFGADSTDAIQGGLAVDRLYGGSGSDILVGGAGDDYLEGGTGMDVYDYRADTKFFIPTNDGADTVRDTDGEGVLRYTFQAGALDALQTRVIAGAAIEQSDTQWKSADGKFTYGKVGNDLTVTINGDAGGTLTLRGFRDGDFGIRLLEVPSDPTTTTNIYGDLEPIDINPPNNEYGFDSLGNIITSGNAAPDRVDVLFDSTGSDFIYAAGGNDIVDATRGGGDWIQAGAGADRITAGSGDDLIEGGSEEDIVFAGNGADRVYGEGRVVIQTAIANGETDSAIGIQGDLLAGGAGDDQIVGSATNDMIFGGVGKDVISGGASDDTLFGDVDATSAAFAWSSSRLFYFEDNEPRAVVGFTGVDFPTQADASQGGADTIYGGAGRDWIFAGGGDDFVDAGSGDDVVTGFGGNDILIGGTGDDTLIGDGTDGTQSGDTPAEFQGNDYLEGGDGIDTLYGEGGDDVLVGGAGQDILHGEAGNDLLWGGTGDDVIYRSTGKDTFYYNKGDGTDYVMPAAVAPGAGNTFDIATGPDIRPGDVKFRLGSLMVDFGNGDAIHLDGFDPNDPYSTRVLDSIMFADGTSMSYLDVLAQGFDLDGTEEDDLLFGTAVTDRMDGKGGDDVVAGGSGDDTLTGGTGNDQVFGQEGKDRYVFRRGDGVDVVNDAAVEMDASDASVLQFGEGIARADLTFRLDAARNLLVDAGQGDTVAFGGFSTSNPVSTPVLASIEFADQTSMSYAELLTQGFDLEGSDDDDAIHGTGVTDRVEGLEGNDYARTDAGDDVLNGGAGDDVLDAGDGNDLLDGGNGNDTLYGGEGNDTLVGGEGADSLQGDAGDDSIFAGDGDTVIDTQGNNHLDLTAYTALNATNLEITQFQADGGDLYLNLHARDAAHPGQTPATGGVSFAGGLGSFVTVTLNDGAGGTVTLGGSELGAYIAGGVVMSGTAGADVMSGTGGEDTIQGLEGADTIEAGAGNDRIDGGLGNDTLSGGAGNDTYLLAFNGGRDTVIEDGEAGSTNTVQLDAGITADMLAAARLGDDLRIQVSATGDSLLVKDFYTQPQAWQDAWSVLDSGGVSTGIAALTQTVIPTAAQWLEAQKEGFRGRRDQVFASARIGERLAPDGSGKYQRIDRGFSYEAGQATSTTTVSWLTAPETIYANGANQSIDTSYAAVRTTLITSFVQLVSPSVLQSTGEGRSAPQSTFGIAGNGGRPNPYFIPASQGFHGFSVQQGSGITYTPVYGPYTGIPPRNELGQIDPNALELKGWYVYTGPAPTASSSPLAQRLIQNVVQTVALATTLDTHITVSDVAVSGSDLARSIVAQNSLVEAGGGDDSIQLTATAHTTTSNNIAEYPTLNFFRLPTWQPDVSLNSLIDTRSPSAAQWRFKQLKKPAGEILDIRYGDMSLPGLRTLGAFVDAGDGEDEVAGGEGDDTIAGGDGDDFIDGGYGADTYLYSADENGIDLLVDFGYVDSPAYGDWYYWNRGILNWDERLEHGGQYRHGGNEVNEGVSYWDTPEEAWNHFFVGAPLDYIEPLAEFPQNLTRNDTAALNELMDTGVLPRDVVKFGPGLSLSDLELSVSVDPESLADHPEQPWYEGGTLSVRWGNAGFDTYAPPVQLGELLVNDENFLGEGIEAFEFADGTSYTLEEILNAAKLVIVGSEEDDELVGGARDELLDGLEGDDRLDGGAGNDILKGGSGEDSYVFGRGYGADTVADYDGGLGGIDAVEFSANIAPADLSLTRQGANLVAHIAGSADVLTVKGQFRDASAIEAFAFTDGTTWDGADIYDQFLAENHTPVLLQAIADQVAPVATPFSFAPPAGTFFDADPGEALQYSATLADGSTLPSWLSISPISGRLYGTPGEDDTGTLEIRVTASDPFGASAEAEFSLQVAVPIVGTEYDDYLEGTEGADFIYAGGGYDTVEGMGGNDTIYGGADDDELSDESGDDTYVHARGDGFDWVYDEDGFDTLQFAGDIAPGEVLVTRDPYGSLYLEIGSREDVVAFEGWFADEYQIEQVTFSDGTVWDAAEIEARVTTTPATALSDLLNLSDANDVADGLAGDDWIFGNDGNDALFGGEGSDSLDGGAGVNLLAGGSGDDYQYADFGAASVVLFNAGDGEDFVSMQGGPVVLSLGGVALADITLEAGDWDFVRIGMGTGGGIGTYNYVADSQSWPSGTLQLIGTDIRSYDLNAVVQAFFDARAQNPAITQWSAAAALQDNLLSVSTTEAYGGALAYQYATTGGIDGLTAAERQAVIDSADFGIAPQSIAFANQAPTDLALSANAIAENAPNATVGTLSTTDGDAGDTFSYSILSGGDGAQFAIAGNELRVGAAGLDYEAGATRTVNVRTMDAAGAHFDRAFSINVTDVQEGNTAPVVSASDTTVVLGQSVAASSLFSVADVENNAIVQYEFWDSTSGSGHFTVNGAEQGVNVSIVVPSSFLQDTLFVGSSAIGNDLVWVRANDGQAWSDWKSWTVYSSPHLTNALPAIAAANGELLIGDSIAASSLFAVTDADNDTITQYEFWDDVAGGGYFSVNGVQQGAAQSIAVSASDLANTDYVAGSTPGTEQVWVRASDGIGWGTWKNWNMTSALHASDAAPEVTPTAATQTVTLGQSLDASSLFAVSDADGDPIAQYEFWDSTSGNGRFEIDGLEQGVNVSILVPAADLSDTRFVGASSTGSDQVWVRASDGQKWGDWKSWTMNSWVHATNSVPVVTAGTAMLVANEVVSASSLFSVTDADGDSIARYEFWDDVNGGGYFRVNGIQQGAAQAIVVATADLADTEYVGGANPGTEQVWVRANDGMEWGAWKPWNMTTALHIPNAAPAVTASDSTVLLNDVVAVSSLFSVADADDDPITQYEFWDSTSGNGHFAVNDVAQGVNVSIVVSAANLANTEFVASGAIGSDQVWVRANDGQVWSDWRSWHVNSAPHLINIAPVISASTQGLLRNEVVAAGSLFSVLDGDGDAVTQYQFWDDVNGGGHFELNSVQQAAGQNIDVSAAQLANTIYVGGSNAGTEQVWVRASDGIAWGAWKNWMIATEGGMQRGGVGPDILNGDPDTPVLEGGDGDDTLNAGDPDSLLSGGDGDDVLNGGAGDDLLAGGAGNDTIDTGAGSNVVVFNAGEGADSILSAAGSSNTLSLGGGIDYENLSLSKDGNDLVLNAGGDDSVRLKDWYNGKDTMDKLQLILDATDNYDANASDPMYSRRVQTFDFRGLVSQFDQALAQSPGLTSWALTNALLQFHLSGADDAALGGDLAYWYGKNNGFAGISLAAAQQAIGAAGFGAEAHSLHGFSGLEEGLVKLA